MHFSFELFLLWPCNYESLNSIECVTIEVLLCSLIQVCFFNILPGDDSQIIWFLTFCVHTMHDCYKVLPLCYKLLQVGIDCDQYKTEDNSLAHTITDCFRQKSMLVIVFVLLSASCHAGGNTYSCFRQCNNFALKLGFLVCLCSLDKTGSEVGQEHRLN